MLDVNNVLSKLGTVKNEAAREIQQTFGLKSAGKNLAPLKSDTVSFTGSIKFAEFSDMTKALIKKLGIQPKNCRTKRQLDSTVNKAFQQEVVEKDFFGSNTQVNILRDDILQTWRKHLVDDKAYDQATSLMIFRSVTKDLYKGEHNLPLKLDEKVLAEVVSDFEKAVAKSKTGTATNFDFAKVYGQKYYENKWAGQKLKINPDPFKKPKGVDENTYKTPILSDNNGRAIVSAQVKNGQIIRLDYPKRYTDDVKAYLGMHGLKKSLAASVAEKLDLDQILSTKIAVFKKEFADLYAKKDYKAILANFDIDIDDKWTRNWLREDGANSPLLYSCEDIGIPKKALLKFLDKYELAKKRELDLADKNAILSVMDRRHKNDTVSVYYLDK